MKFYNILEILETDVKILNFRFEKNKILIYLTVIFNFPYSTKAIQNFISKVIDEKNNL